MRFGGKDKKRWWVNALEKLLIICPTRQYDSNTHPACFQV